MKDRHLSLSRKAYDLIMKSIMIICSFITIALISFLIVYVCIRGLPNVSWELLTSSPSFLQGTTGIFPDIINTLYVLLIALLVVLPIGVGGAIYLSEYAKNQKLVRIIRLATETLSGIPSIIYGLVGMLFFVNFCGLGTSLLAGALTLVIMNLPTIIRTTEEALRSVPGSYRVGAFALGAGKWRVIRTVVLPSALPGIVTGMILSAGRIVGESAALLYTAGLAHTLSGFFQQITSSGATLTVALYIYASERGDFETGFAIAAVLMILTLIINMSAELVTILFTRKR